MKTDDTEGIGRQRAKPCAPCVPRDPIHLSVLCPPLANSKRENHTTFKLAG